MIQEDDSKYLVFNNIQLFGCKIKENCVDPVPEKVLTDEE